MERDTVTAFNTTFVIASEWEFTKPVGQGAYGCVIAATHRETSVGCAIKKITKINRKLILTKRCLREIRLLRHFRGHKNITCLYDLDIVFQENGDFDEVYCYEELMDANLDTIIRSGQPLTDAHFQSLIYQTICGLRYIHSADVLHRDLKPSNLLVNASCQLKICDFGLARSYKAGKAGLMTEYVATRWYRAPEIMLSFANYTTAIDMWSVGCILAELLGRKPIFVGKDYLDQLNQILNCLGTPSEETLRRVGSPRAQDYIRSLPIKTSIPFPELFPDASSTAIDLLSKMLRFDPTGRLSCDEALNHPYFVGWRDHEGEKLCPRKFSGLAFEDEDSIPGLKKLIIEEVESFRSDVRERASADTVRRQNTSLTVDGSAADSTNQERERAHPWGLDGPISRTSSPEVDDPSEALDMELESVGSEMSE